MRYVKLGVPRVILGLGTYLCLAWAVPGHAGPVVQVGGEVPASQRVPAQQIDHAVWDGLLRKYVDRVGMVDYKAWKRSAADQQALDRYLEQLSSVSLRSSRSREALLAYWINAYNAVTVKGILREYPTSSIRNHTAKLFGYNIWKDLHLVVEGKGYSLDEIEHQILRKMEEPRIHFAIVCASIGCPRLLREAYTAERLDEQLTHNTQAFFADATKLEVDVPQRRIAVSPILKWFAEDFGATQADQLRWMAPYLPDETTRQLAQSGQAQVSYLPYDWGLNDQAQVGRTAGN